MRPPHILSKCGKVTFGGPVTRRALGVACSSIASRRATAPSNRWLSGGGGMEPRKRTRRRAPRARASLCARRAVPCAAEFRADRLASSPVAFLALNSDVRRGFYFAAVRRAHRARATRRSRTAASKRLPASMRRRIACAWATEFMAPARTALSRRSNSRWMIAGDGATVAYASLAAFSGRPGLLKLRMHRGAHGAQAGFGNGGATRRLHARLLPRRMRGQALSRASSRTRPEASAQALRELQTGWFLNDGQNARLRGHWAYEQRLDALARGRPQSSA